MLALDVAKHVVDVGAADGVDGSLPQCGRTYFSICLRISRAVRSPRRSTRSFSQTRHLPEALHATRLQSVLAGGSNFACALRACAMLISG